MIKKEDKSMLKKLRDVSKEFIEWKQKNCILDAECSKCVLRGYYCERFSERIWVGNKRKIEIGGILTKDEKEYLRAVIKPFRDRIIYIKKTIVFDGYGVNYAECISIISKYKDEEEEYITELPIFEEYSLYKGMEVEKEYTLEELGL